MKSWTCLNSEYEYNLCDSNERENFIKNNFPKKVYDAYCRLLPGIYKTDLWKYCILYMHGGIYTDITNKCLQSMVKFFKFDAKFVHGIDPKLW